MDTFELFSLEHFLNLGGYLALTLLLVFFTSISYKKNRIAKISAFFMLVLKAVETLYRYHYIGEPFTDLLPLHLCNIALVTAIITMIFRSYFFFELTYFWTIGTFFALLTPEVKLNFPNFWNITFFTTHYYLIYTVIFTIKFWKFRPTKKSLYKAIIFLNVIFILVFIINNKLGTNYMFVTYKPSFESPIDYLGPWPYYILGFEIIGAVLFTLAYLPFRNKKHLFSTKD